MTHSDLYAIAAELNSRARSHPIGDLQTIRAKFKQLSRRPGQDIFRLEGPSKTVFSEWAFHYGGRPELQFNIGHDGSGGSMLRHGVAFSFEPSRSLPASKLLSVLGPKALLFKEFVQVDSDRFADMRMWHSERNVRSDDYMPGPIAPERVKVGVFVFLGKLRPMDQLDYELILDDFDRLLPLYCYVASDGHSHPASMSTAGGFSFHPGCSLKAQSAVVTHAQSQLDVSLRHNLLQDTLHERLKSRFGADNVGTENRSGIGSVDLIVRRPEGYWFYEIKTAQSPRACIREAVGQLLEYAFWPGGQEACRLIVVGETAVDRDGKKYLRRLRERFSLPIEYEQIVV